MPPPGPNNDPFGVSDDERALVPILDEFDQLLAAGQDPKVEEFLGRVPQATQRLLLLELVLRLQFRDKTRPRRKWNEFIAEWPLLQGWPEAEDKLRAQQDELEASDLAKTFVETAPEASPIPKVKPIQNWERRFQNVTKIGEGGFGTVYRGLDTKTGNDVAIKVVDEFEIYRRLEKKKKSPAEIRKQIAAAKCTLEREVQSLRNLHHPNIVALLDFDFPHEQGQDSYLVYQFVEGGTLRQKMTGPFDVKEAIRIIGTLARALHFAHQRNLIHQDIKPENILLDLNGKPFLADFGLAVSKDEILAGTPAGGTKWYVSKEQLQGKKYKIGHRTDIYSLGVVLYEMLAGKRPIDSPDKNWRDAICEYIYVPLWIINANAPSDDRVKKQLDAICDHALKNEPVERIASAEFMAEQLDEVLERMKSVTPLPPDAVVTPLPPDPVVTSLPLDPVVTSLPLDPVVTPPQNKKFSRLALAFGSVCVIAAILFVGFIFFPPPGIRDVLAAELGTREFSVYRTRAEKDDASCLVSPFVGREELPLLLVPSLAETAPAFHGFDDFFKSNGLEKSRFAFPFQPTESDWIKLTGAERESRNADVSSYSFDLCDPKELESGAPLAAISQRVFGTSSLDSRSSDALIVGVAGRVSPKQDGFDIKSDLAEVAIGSPLFTLKPTSLDTDLWHRLENRFRPKIAVAGIVIATDRKQNQISVRSLKRLREDAQSWKHSKAPTEIKSVVNPPPVLNANLTTPSTSECLSKRVLPVTVTFSQPFSGQLPAIADILDLSGNAADGAQFDSESSTIDRKILSANLLVGRDGDINIKFRKSFRDKYGISNAESQTTLKRIIDTQRPTLNLTTVLSVHEVVPVGHTLTVRVDVAGNEVVTLSNEVLKLIQTPNATLISDLVTPNGPSFKFFVRPDRPGKIVITVADGFASDCAGNLSAETSAAVEARLIPDRAEITQWRSRALAAFADRMPTGQRRMDQIKFEDGKKLCDDLAQQFDGLEPQLLESSTPKWVWECYCFRGAVEMDVAAAAHAAAIETYKSDRMESDRWKNRAKDYQQRAIKSLSFGQKATPSPDQGGALLGLLSARCRIDMANLIARVNADEKKAATEGLTKAETVLNELKNLETPQRLGSRYSGYRTYLMTRLLASKQWVEQGVLPNDNDSAPVPKYYDELRDSLVTYWPEQ